jgi:hypothetical protein
MDIIIMMRTLNNLKKERGRKAYDKVKTILMEKKIDTIMYFLFPIFYFSIQYGLPLFSYHYKSNNYVNMYFGMYFCVEFYF